MKTIERHRYDGDYIFETRVLEFEPWSLDDVGEVLNLIQERVHKKCKRKKIKKEIHKS